MRTAWVKNIMDNKQLVRIVLISLLALGCAFIIQPFVAALLFAAIVCTATWPVYSWLLVRMRGRQALTATLMTLLLTLLVLLPMVFVSASLTNVVPTLTEKVGQMLAQAQVAPPDWLHTIPIVGEPLASYWQLLGGSRQEFNKLMLQLYDPAKTLLVGAGALAGEGLLQLALTLFIAFFFYRDGQTLVSRLRKASRQLGGDLGDQMLALTHSTIMGVMIGIVGTAVVQSLVALIGFLIAGVPGAMLLATATFFLSMVPIGPPLIWGGAAFWLFDQGQIGWAIFMVVWGLLVISSVDNFVKPVLISRTSSLPIMLIALGVFGGILAFGFVGIFVGPTLLALGLVLTDKWTSGEMRHTPAPQPPQAPSPPAP
jgi:predicted PurR-regulated permease PerM